MTNTQKTETKMKTTYKTESNIRFRYMEENKIPSLQNPCDTIWKHPTDDTIRRVLPYIICRYIKVLFSVQFTVAACIQ